MSDWRHWALVIGWLITGNQLLFAQDHSPRSSARALQARQGYRVELVADESLTIDPVAARFDSRGRMWVVEMPDYPTGPREGEPPAGRIRILRDSDSDGRFDDATTFADRLTFATGVQPYGDGAFVTLAGKVVQFRDRDADGVADERDVLFKGFATGNEQLRANHPTLGPDGLIYVAGGLRGGKITSVDPRFDAKHGPVDLRDRDFCFDPEGGLWKAVAGKSQFGLTIDDFGRRVGCSNRNPAMFPPLTLSAIQRDRLLVPRDAVADIAPAAEKSKVVPMSDAWTTSNLHAGQFSAACGVIAPGLVSGDQEWLLVCEPTGSLVQRQRLFRQGSIWASLREPQPAEFLASTDSWFRPVDLTIGPGRGVYVVDMARAVIEHPDWVPDELKDRPDTWYGNELGRIWQLTPTSKQDSAPEVSETTSGSAKAASQKQEGGQTEAASQSLAENLQDDARSIDQPADALRWLGARNPWKREMASQYFLTRGMDTHLEELRSRLRSPQQPATCRSRIALLFDRHQQLSDDDCASLLRSEQPRLRALGVRLAAERGSLLDSLLELADDSDPLVRRHLAQVLGSAGRQNDRRAQMLADIARRDAETDPWIRRSIASVDAKLTEPLAKRLLQTADPNPELCSHLVRRIAESSPVAAATVLTTRLTGDAGTTRLSTLSASLIQAWHQGIRATGSSVVAVMPQLRPKERSAIESAHRSAVRTALSESADAKTRAVCVRLVAEAEQVSETFRELATPPTPLAVREAAIGVLLDHDTQWARKFLDDQLTKMTLRLRLHVVDACLRSRSNTRWMLSRIEQGRMPKSIVDPATAGRLRKHSDEAIRKMANGLFAASPDRLRVLERYSSAASLGDTQAGEKLFVEHCSACHKIDGTGTNVGPDISDTRTKKPEELLTAILVPNTAIDADYMKHSVLTHDGRIIEGLLVDETNTSMTLAQQGGERVTLTREEIEQVQTPGVSLMPEGFEQSMTVEQMADLLAYLKNWRYLKNDIPVKLTR